MLRVKIEKLKVYVVTLYKIHQPLGLKDLQEKPIKDVIPKEYHEFLPLFSKVIAELLKPHRQYAHMIVLQQGFTSPFGLMYCISCTKIEFLKEWIEQNLSRGLIQSSSSPCGVPVHFAPRPGEGPRYCVDYRGLNGGRFKNHYPVQLIQEILLRLSKARY